MSRNPVHALVRALVRAQFRARVHAQPRVRSRRASRLRRGAGVIVAASAFIFASALPAAAHVTVHPGEAVGGSWAKLTFRVPTESATASTTSLTLTFPTDHPLASVSLKPKQGWVATTATAALPTPVEVNGATLTKAIHTVTWRADGEGILPGQFDEFEASAGPFPASGTLVFDAAQTYSDGTVVNWDQTTPDAEHPAPVVTITDSSGHASAAGAGNDAVARGLGVAAIVVGLLAVALAVRAPHKPRGRRAAE